MRELNGLLAELPPKDGVLPNTPPVAGAPNPSHMHAIKKKKLTSTGVYKPVLGEVAPNAGLFMPAPAPNAGVEVTPNPVELEPKDGVDVLPNGAALAPNAGALPPNAVVVGAEPNVLPPNEEVAPNAGVLGAPETPPPVAPPPNNPPPDTAPPAPKVLPNAGAVVPEPPNDDAGVDPKAAVEVGLNPLVDPKVLVLPP